MSRRALVARAAACVVPALLVAPIAASPLAAQEKPVRRTIGAPVILLLPASTRAAAMGGAAVAQADPDAVFANPAQLAAGRGLALAGLRYGDGAAYASASAAFAFAPGGLALGVQQMDYHVACGDCRDAVPAGEGALFTSGTLPAAATIGSLGFGWTLSGLRVGATAKWVEQRLPESRDGAGALDVGVAYQAGPVWLGLVARNVGGSFDLGDPVGSFQLARAVAAGAAFEGLPVGPLDLSASVATTLYDGGTVVPGGGVEVGYSWLEGYSVALRGGARHVPGGGVSPLTLGGALSRDRVTIEYAFQPGDAVASGHVHRAGLRLRP